MTTIPRCNPVKKYSPTALLSAFALSVTLLVSAAPAWADAVTATIPVGTAPNAVAVNSSTNRIYVANGSSNTVTVIDGASNSTTTVAVGTAPNAVAVNASTNRIYVANGSSNTVTVIDGATNSTTMVAVGTSPTAIAVNSSTNKIYVANNGSADVTVIDGATNSTATIAVGAGPNAIAVNSATNKVYVASKGSASVTVIDGVNNRTNTVARAFNDPRAIAVNETTNKIYVVNYPNDSELIVIDGITNAASLVVNGSHHHPDDFAAVAINPLTNQIYVPGIAHGDTNVINGISGVRISIPTQGQFVGDIAINLVSNKVYIVNNAAADMTVIDGTTSSYVKIAVGNYPRAIAVNPVTNRIYVANIWSNDVSVIDGAAAATPPATATSLTNSSIYGVIRYGDTVTYTASVSGVSSTGSVAFQDGGVTIAGCAAQALQGGKATCTVSIQTLALGTHIFTANYSSDGINVSSSSAWFRNDVYLAYATTILTSSSNPSNFGSGVTFTAAVSSAWSPTGTVYFSQNNVPIDGCTAVTLVAGIATCTTAVLSSGSHLVYAWYSGDSFHVSSSENLTQDVNSAPLTPTSTSIFSSSNPSKYHNNVTFTATIASGSATGMVAFRDGGVNIVGCAGQVVSAGMATCTVNTLTLGSHSITAYYLGDVSYYESISPALTQSVLKNLRK